MFDENFKPRSIHSAEDLSVAKKYLPARAAPQLTATPKAVARLFESNPAQIKILDSDQATLPKMLSHPALRNKRL